MADPRQPKVHVLMFTDGRQECFKQTYESFLDNVHGEYHMTIVNDEPSMGYVKWLDQWCADGEPVQIIHSHHRQGFGGAIQTGWGAVPPATDYVFHLEDDFVFLEPINLIELAELLHYIPSLVQIAYKRQAWNPEERAAGGIVELHPGDFDEQETHIGPITTHRKFFTTNPSMYRAELVRRRWPQVPRSEGIFTHQLLESDPKLCFAFLGGKFDRPKVHHIGAERVGCGY